MTEDEKSTLRRLADERGIAPTRVEIAPADRSGYFRVFPAPRRLIEMPGPRGFCNLSDPDEEVFRLAKQAQSFGKKLARRLGVELIDRSGEVSGRAVVNLDRRARSPLTAPTAAPLPTAIPS